MLDIGGHRAYSVDKSGEKWGKVDPLVDNWPDSTDIRFHCTQIESLPSPRRCVHG